MIVIPMAGLSSRFFKAGYTLPKYMLDLDGKTVFEWSVSSFYQHFKTDHFLFIIFDHFETKSFVEREVLKMGIENYSIVTLTEHTKGQADTVYQGIKNLKKDDDLYIFNIDSRLNKFEKLKENKQVDGYLEVFKGEGDHWSFILPGENGEVLKTTEKVRISEFCSNGLYYFKSALEFSKKVKLALDVFDGSEIYIAPLYNDYIEEKKCVKYKEVSLNDIEFCGTPQEYIDTLNRIRRA